MTELQETLRKIPSTDLGVDAELAFRRAQDKLLLGKEGNGRKVQDFSTCDFREEILELLDFAIAFGKESESISHNIPKIPFLLIEDLLQCQTLSNAKLIWEVIESKVDALTQTTLFNRGKFIILRTSNALLKRLSRSCHTEFCGRILMFLASVYPLSEKSAVNLMGKVNVGNVTHFEDEEDFKSALSGSATKDDTKVDGQDEAAETNEAKLSAAGKEAIKESIEGEEMEVEEAVPSSSVGESPVNYHLYKVFWEIQSFLSCDPKVMEQKNKWPELLKSAKLLLDTFEADCNKSEIRQAKRRHEQELKVAQCINSNNRAAKEILPGSFNTGESHYMGCKYLTSSQLFSLEFHDPAIRLQLGIQLLIAVHHRLKSPPSDLKPTSTVSTAPSSVVSEADLTELEQRIFGLLESTPLVRGEELLRTLRSLLSSAESREESWLRWKQSHCPSFEQPPATLALSAGDEGDRERKRRRMSSEAAADSTGGFFFEHQWEAMREATRRLVQQVPSMELHLQDFVDAEDPEAGIEDEYHPKHDTMYCWRARRLMATSKLSVFEEMAEGNVGKGVKLLGLLPEVQALPPNQEQEAS